MPLRQERFLSFRDLIYGDVERTFELLLTVGLNVCESLRRLHLKGLCYRDLNLGNFCFDAKTGAVEVLDNDNTDAEGEGVSIGVTDFAAPELLLGAAKASRYTDLWSLAVLLFQLTVLTDPFIGQRLVTEHGGVYDSDANRQLHARPVFIFDPQDQSNLPLPGETRAEALWRHYPEALRALFIKSFTIGARAPRARVTEAEWEQALIRARDGLVPCASCDAHNILEFEATRSTAPDCLACGQPLVMPRVLKIGAWRVALRAGARLRRHHLGRAGAHDPSSPIAEVIASPVRLRNLSPFHWTCSAGGGQRAVVGEGDCVVIEDDLRIDFGAAQGYVAQS
jgi:serine/threonine protein kinase